MCSQHFLQTVYSTQRNLAYSMWTARIPRLLPAPIIYLCLVGIGWIPVFISNWINKHELPMYFRLDSSVYFLSLKLPIPKTFTEAFLMPVHGGARRDMIAASFVFCGVCVHRHPSEENFHKVMFLFDAVSVNYSQNCVSEPSAAESIISVARWDR